LRIWRIQQRQACIRRETNLPEDIGLLPLHFSSELLRQRVEGSTLKILVWRKEDENFARDTELLLEVDAESTENPGAPTQVLISGICKVEERRLILGVPKGVVESLSNRPTVKEVIASVLEACVHALTLSKK